MLIIKVQRELATARSSRNLLRFARGGRRLQLRRLERVRFGEDRGLVEPANPTMERERYLPAVPPRLFRSRPYLRK